MLFKKLDMWKLAHLVWDDVDTTAWSHKQKSYVERHDRDTKNNYFLLFLIYWQ